uniref:Uncharacterized protein n=1 Tax=mine drainage metagenome TaxID=410659 RepID=E6PPV9_9ZZZZ
MVRPKGRAGSRESRRVDADQNKPPSTVFQALEWIHHFDAWTVLADQAMLTCGQVFGAGRNAACCRTFSWALNQGDARG